MHIATGRSLSLEMVAENIIITFYGVLQWHEVFYSLQVKNLSLFNVPFNFNIWRLESMVFFNN